MALGLLGLLLLVMSVAEPPSRDGWLGAGIGLAVVAVLGAQVTGNTAMVSHRGPLSIPDGVVERFFLPLVVVVTTANASWILAAADRSRISARAALAAALGVALTLAATCARSDARASDATYDVPSDAVALPNPCDGQIDLGEGVVLECWTRTDMTRPTTFVAILPQRARGAGAPMRREAPFVARRFDGRVLVSSVRDGQIYGGLVLGITSGPFQRLLRSDFVEVPRIPSDLAFLLVFGVVSLCVGAVLAARAVRRSQRLDRAVVARRAARETGFALADGTTVRLNEDARGDVVMVELSSTTEGYRVNAVVSGTVVERGEPQIVRAVLRARMLRLAFVIATCALLFFGPLAALRLAGWAFAG